MEFIFIPLFACIILMIGEHSNPRGMNIFWYKVNIARRDYFKALTEYDSGNNKGNGMHNPMEIVKDGTTESNTER